MVVMVMVMVVVVAAMAAERGGRTRAIEEKERRLSPSEGYVTSVRACRPSERCGYDLLDPLSLSARHRGPGRLVGVLATVAATAAAVERASALDPLDTGTATRHVRHSFR